MMILKRIFIFSWFFAFFISGVFASPSFPEHPTGFVTDTTSTLTTEQITTLDVKLSSYEKETGSEIAVAMIPTTDGMDIAQYATELGNKWGVGKEKVDNGILLVIAKDDRELFIATGRQMEGALTDLEGKDIIDSVITPRFKEGNFYEGINAGIDGMLLAIKDESFTDLRMDQNNSSGSNFFDVIVFIIFFSFSWLGAILGRSKAVWPGALIGFLVGGGMTYFDNIALFKEAGIVIILFFTLFGWVFDWIVSKNYAEAQKSGSKPSWWAGGNSLGGGSSGGFGGFSGGGFSGGGSRGRW